MSWAPERVAPPASVQPGRVVRPMGPESTQVQWNAPTVPQLAVAAGALVNAGAGAGASAGPGAGAGAAAWAAGEQTRTVPYTRPVTAPAGEGRADITQSIRRRPRRARWFVLGIAFGAIGAVVVTGDAPSTLDGARAWGARALRSLERRAPPPPVKSGPTTATATTDPGAPLATWSHGDAAWARGDAPCPMNPSPDDPCAELLAPFANVPASPGSVPLVRVDDLPRVRPMVVAYVARHPGAGAGASAGANAGAGAGANAGASASPTPSAPLDGETADGPLGINPYDDDPQAPPSRARVVPTAPAAPSAAPPPPPRERTLPDPPPSELPFTASAG